MGIIRLSVATIAALGAVLLVYGEDHGSPQSLGRETSLLQAVLPDSGAKGTDDLSEALTLAMRSDASPETETDIALFEPEEPARAEGDAMLVQATASSDDLAEPVAQPAPDPEISFLYVSGSRVNVRGGPSTDYGVISSLGYGTQVEDLGHAADGWREIRLLETGERGFMAGRFLTDDAL